MWISLATTTFFQQGPIFLGIVPKSRFYMRLSREEFWVLDATAQRNYSIHIGTLTNPESGFHFNKADHSMTNDQLADLLVFMQKQGDLVIYRSKKDLFPEFNAERVSWRSPGIRVVIDYTSVWENPVFYPKSEIIEEFFTDTQERKERAAARDARIKNPELPPIQFPFRERLCFCATHQGAEKWEETAQVDWSKYLACWGKTPDDADLAENQSLCCWRVAAPSQQLLDAYFDWKLRWGAHPDAWETSSVRRYHTERIAPWKATYWKTLPEGFECDFTEFTVRRERMTKRESDRHSSNVGKQPWDEHHVLFDWCNRWVRDFPFEGD